MEEDEAQSTVPPGISISDPAEDTEADHTNPGASKQPASSASETPLETHDESPHVMGAIAQPEPTRGNGHRNDNIDGASLSEVRGSLQIISNGVEELATTVKDLLGLSESEDSDDSSDCSYDSDGGRAFSWSRFKSRARKRRRRRQPLKNRTKGGHFVGFAEDEASSDSAKGSDEGSTKSREVILGLRECNLEQFQSRPAGDDHKLHCVDILIAGDSLDDEIRDFDLLVSRIRAGTVKSWKPGQTSKRTTEDPASDVPHKKWIRRIRINSQAVMRIIRKVCGVSEDRIFQPVVFHRPFQVLVSRNEEMKEELANLKRLVSATSIEVTDPIVSEEGKDDQC